MLSPMAWTQTDLDNVKAALATGELSVSFEDGRKVEFRSIGDLLKVKHAIEAELTAADTTRLTPRYQQAGFSDG